MDENQGTFLTGTQGQSGQATQPASRPEGSTTPVTTLIHSGTGEASHSLNIREPLDKLGKQDLRDRINVAMKSKAYTTGSGREHKEMVDYVQRLHDGLYGNESYNPIAEKLRARGTPDEMSDEQLKRLQDESPSVSPESLEEEKAIKDGMKEFLSMHHGDKEKAMAIAEHAQGLMKIGKQFGLKQDVLDWVEENFGNDPTFLTTAGILFAMIQDRRGGSNKREPTAKERRNFYLKKADELSRKGAL